MEARLFASQTLRTKVSCTISIPAAFHRAVFRTTKGGITDPQILYDLKDIPQAQLFPLRDSLITSLPPLIQPSAPSGSRAVLIQICAAISDLGLQVAEWEEPVKDMIERFGKDPATVRILLEFLKSWIEESMNPHVRTIVSVIITRRFEASWANGGEG